MASALDKATTVDIGPRLRTLSSLAALVSAAVAAVVWIGWTFDLPNLQSLGADAAGMKANTAACILAGSAALLLLQPAVRRLPLMAVAYALALLMLALSGATLLESLLRLDLGIDQLIFADPRAGTDAAWPGRMGINSATSLALLAVGVLLLDWQRGWRGYVAQFPALCAGIVGLGAIIGYVEGIQSLHHIPSYADMALPTAICVFALATGMLFARTDSGFAAWVSRPGPGGAMMRRLLPLAIGVPILLDWLRLRGESAGWYGEEAGLVLLLVANILCMIALINLTIAPFNILLEQLRQSRERVATEKAELTAILASADRFVIATDADGIISTLNTTAQRWLGYSADEVVGKQTPLIFHDTDQVAQRAQQLSTELLRPIPPGFEVLVTKARLGVSDENEWIYVRKDGSSFPVSLSVSAMRDEEGAIIGFVGIASDITARREVERIKNEFISTVSHELRTPLTSIRGALGLLEGGLMEGVSSQARSLVHIAYNNCERLIRLINDILDVEKISAGKMVFNFQVIVLDELIKESLAANRSYADQYKIWFHLIKNVSGHSVNVDTDRLSQVMNNLLSNAAKFSPPGSEVEVKLESAALGLRVSVADRGSGVPPAFRDRLFSRFEQADASNMRRTGGTGLGLSICKTIMERMDGSIGYEPRPGGGSIFYFELPVADAAAPTAMKQTAE